MVKDDII